MRIFKPSVFKVLLGFIVAGILTFAAFQVVLTFFGHEPTALEYFLLFLLAPFGFLFELLGFDLNLDRGGDLFLILFLFSQLLYGYILAPLVLCVVKKVFSKVVKPKPAPSRILLGFILAGILTFAALQVAPTLLSELGALGFFLMFLLAPLPFFFQLLRFNAIVDGNVYLFFVFVSQLLYGYVLAPLVLYVLKKVFRGR